MAKTEPGMKRILRPSMLWAIWLFPVIAVILTSYIFFDFYQKRGPLITISVSDAAGVEAGKTPLRFRGIDVGRVEDIILSKDTKEVVMHARLRREGQYLATEGAKFYVVQPEVGFEGVRGLETLFKGPYIRVEQGGGGKKLDFKGFTGDADETVPGTTAYYLNTRFLQSISQGDAVSFRGMKIGTVTNTKLDGGGQSVDIQINIEKKYTKYIRTNTMFWPKIGVHAKLGLFNSEVKVNSFENLLRGGIDCASPDGAGPMVKPGHRFKLSEKPVENWEKWSPDLTKE